MEEEKNNVTEAVATPVKDAVKPKKKKNVAAILLGILALILAGVATFFGLDYFGIIGEEKIKEVVTIEKVPEEVIVEITTSTMAEEYKEVKETIEMLTEGVENYWDRVGNKGALMYKPEGLNVHVPMKFVLDIEINNSNSSETNMTAIDNKLRSSGFSPIGILPHGGSAGPEIQGYLNSEKEIVCGLYSDTEWRTQNFSVDYVNLSCAKTSWVWLTEEDKALINELSEAAKEKRGDYPTVLTIGGKIENSQYEPYQTMTVGVGGAAGLFYRVSPEAKWQFFAATQGVLSCSEYNTDDLKKAYLGDICYGEGDQGPLKVEL